jgi:phage shock protein A
MATDYTKAAGEVVAAAKDFIRRSLAPITENVGGLVQRMDKHHQQIESAERRLSRQGEHLARLEDRVRRLEGK